MVIVGHRSEGERDHSKTSPENFTMATTKQRSRSSLHNFSLALKWGDQRQLRCVRAIDDGARGVDGGGDRFPAPNRRSLTTRSGRKRKFFNEPENSERPSSSTRPPPDLRRRASISDNNGGIGAVTSRIVLDFQTQVDGMKSAVLCEGNGEKIEPPPIRKAEEARPWNLRSQRSACTDPSTNGRTDGRIDERKPGLRVPAASVKSSARLSVFEGGENGDTGGERRSRAKLCVPLTKREIEDDFVAMTGIRPPKKPKKRPRHVQRQIDRFFPGLWLSEIRASMYKVNEHADGAKS